jgi:hypothetical protein
LCEKVNFFLKCCFGVFHKHTTFQLGISALASNMRIKKLDILENNFYKNFGEKENYFYLKGGN